MGFLSVSGWLILLVAAINTEDYQKPTLLIHSNCLGNIMRVDASQLGGNLLEVAAVANNSAFLLTPSVAAQCGFRVKTDQLGKAKIYASLLNCFAQNVEDHTFMTTLSLRLHGNWMTEGEVYQGAKTCHYPRWASREIVCDQNYMEVSVRRASPDDYTLPDYNVKGAGQKFNQRRAAEPIDAGYRITTIVFLTPVERMMKVAEAHRSGYGIASTATRLILRSPTSSHETYTQDVAGVTMNVLRASVIFEKKWLATQIDAAAACPTLEGSVSFTPDMITWSLPKHIDPLISSGHFRLLEVHLGVDGQRLDPTEMAARRYSLTDNGLSIVVEIPVGAVGGHFKTYVQNYECFTYYTIEPMLELFWTEDDTQEDTRYKVMLPIRTPLMSQPPQVIDNTVPEEHMFKVLLGPFGSDVALMNITSSLIPAEVLSMADCSARGFNVQEHMVSNGSSKVFTLQVPFTDRIVSQMRDVGMTIYSLHMTFDMLVLPEYAPFRLTAHLDARLAEVVHPSISGSCDYQNFYVLVKYGSHNFKFQTIVGRRVLSAALAQQYNFMENATHLSLTVPFTSPDVAFEAIQGSSIRSRLNVALMNLQTNTIVGEFAVACNFTQRLTECFPNGTMTALAVKLESVPSLNPRQLTLSDPTCGPAYSNDHYAYFVFTANSCGTSRKFLPNMMLYENEISLPDEMAVRPDSKEEEPEYELKVSCYYEIDKTHTVSFHTRPRRSEPYAENARGDLEVAIRLAVDNSYSTFYSFEDYPITKFLQQPLYFEVELTTLTSPHVSLELENCWATPTEDRMSQSRWNFIINGCANTVDPSQVIFHPVWADARVQNPSHFKRFEVQMFAFAEDQDNLIDRLFVHCDVVLCDGRNPLGGVCDRQCSNQVTQIRGQKRAVSDGQSFKHASLGPILVKENKNYF